MLLLFSHPVGSDSSRLHGLQQARLPCPSPSPRVCPSSCPLHQWCHPVTSLPLMPTSPSALDLSQHQRLFQWVSCPHQMTKIQELQYQSFQWIFRVAFLKDWLNGLIFLLSKGLSGVFSRTIVQRYQFFGALPSLQSSSHTCICLLRRP